MTQRYYITTPLYYVNDVPHIGHAYTTIAADVLARWKRLRGVPVFFLTGTDEHGAKIAQAAEAKKQTPKEFADAIAGHFQALWKRLGISYDDFIRTTEPRHAAVVREVFETLLKKGDIYKGVYEDWYCVSCETFWSESELVDGKCPTCGRAVEKLKEESYFFKLSRYEQPLLAHYQKHPEFLSPAHRAQEIINFVKSGLRDLSVSRKKVKWGIPIASDPEHTVYVWFDALLNYITAPGWGADQEKFADVWPAQVHLVGKEIFRFHTVIWPAMLMSLGVPQPRRVFAHGWWTVEGQKMSKSVGNVVNPHDIADEYGVDVLRYFVLREVPFGGDGDFSKAALLARYNSELANALGNLLNRTLQLVEKNNDSVIPEGSGGAKTVGGPAVAEWLKLFDDRLEALAFHEALGQIISLVDACNKFIDVEAPWKTVKTDRPRALQCLATILAQLKLAAVALAPFMPETAQKILAQIGESAALEATAAQVFKDSRLAFSPGQKIQKGAPLFPKKQ